MSVPIRPRAAWAWRGGPAFTAPDGSRLRIDQPGLDLSQPWSATFVARLGARRFGLIVTEIGAFDWHVTYTMPDARVRSSHYAGGELLVASRPRPPEYRAAWRGRWFELHHRPAGPAPAGIPAVFDAVGVTDTPEGMLVRPRVPARTWLEPFRIAKQLPGLGQLRIERPGPAAVPRFRGHRTRHGEIWRRPLADGARGRARAEALLLATPTAVAQLIPGPADTDTADADAALAFLEELAVTWEPS